MNGSTAEGFPVAAKSGSQRPLWILVLLVSGALHALVGVGAAVYIVAKWIQPPEATFVAKKTVILAPKIVDPRMAAAEFEAAAPKPMMSEKIASMRATDFALPDVPMVATDQMVDFNPSEFITSEVTGLLGGTGSGGGGGGGGGGSGGGGDGSGLGIDFFGITTKGRSVLILFDISQSVLTKAQKAGVSIEKIKEETRQLIDGISINTTFGLIQFARVFMPFKQQLVAPTQENKQQATNWLDTKFSTSGTLGGSGVISPRPNGIEAVLEYAFKMNPDVIFIISDGDFQRTTHEVEHEQVDLKRLADAVETWQKARMEPAVIHFVGFSIPPEYAADLKHLAHKNGGTFKEMK